MNILSNQNKKNVIAGPVCKPTELKMFLVVFPVMESKALTFGTVQIRRSRFVYQTSHRQQWLSTLPVCLHLALQNLILQIQEKEFHILRLHVRSISWE